LTQVNVSWYLELYSRRGEHDMSGMADLAGFWLYAVRTEIRSMWDSLPGPWPVKLALVVACQAIPGPLDEIALVAVVAAWRRYRARKR
jgi:hypothetical protein